METPQKKMYNTKDLPDNLHQALVDATEYLEDEVLDILEGTDSNIAIFSLVSATARIVGATYANSNLIDETDIKNLAEDFEKTLLGAFLEAKSLGKFTQ
jgi:hypothetical protein